MCVCVCVYIFRSRNRCRCRSGILTSLLSKMKRIHNYDALADDTCVRSHKI